MARPCSICTHPERGAIEQARLKGTSKRQIAALYQVSSDAVQRHTSHIAPDNAPIPHQDNAPPTILNAMTMEQSWHHPIVGTPAHQHVVSYAEFEVSTLTEDALAEADLQKQRYRCCQTDIKLLNRDYRQKLIVWLNEFLQETVYEV